MASPRITAMRILLLLLTGVATSFATISPETLYLEDAEQVEEYLVDLGVSSDLFMVDIQTENDIAVYRIQWLMELIRMDFEAESFTASLTAQSICAEAVAHAINRSKWEPDYLMVIFSDCWTVTPAKVVLEYAVALDNPEEYDALALLSASTQIFPFEGSEIQEESSTN